jgi:hypothetical protein
MKPSVQIMQVADRGVIGRNQKRPAAFFNNPLDIRQHIVRPRPQQFRPEALHLVYSMTLWREDQDVKPLLSKHEA